MSIKTLASIALLLATMLMAANAAAQDDDPLEGYNRAVFQFNRGLDQRILKPAAKAYKAVTPDPVERGVANFFANLGDVVNVPNDLLQGKVAQAGNDGARFLINSTVGLLGLFDVASKMGLEAQEEEDFGQTLAVWGVPAGPYIQIPFLGPSTLRDLPAGLVDGLLLDPQAYINDTVARSAITALEIVDMRAALLDAEALITGDEYSFIRSTYLQEREYQIKDGDVEDDFLDDADADEDW